MKTLLATISAMVATLVLCLISSNSQAQTTEPALPIIRILAIGTLTPGTAPAQARAILPEEVRQTAQLYLEGKIDQWYSLQDRTGVVFVLNVTDEAAARAMLEALPLGQAGLMHFELMRLAPLGPLRQLQGMGPAQQDTHEPGGQQ